jgi:hypothetical protein
MNPLTLLTSVDLLQEPTLDCYKLTILVPYKRVGYLGKGRRKTLIAKVIKK